MTSRGLSISTPGDPNPRRAGRLLLALGAVALLASGSSSAADLIFGFEGMPTQVSGEVGEVKTFDVFATLTTAGNTLPDGVQSHRR